MLLWKQLEANGYPNAGIILKDIERRYQEERSQIDAMSIMQGGNEIVQPTPDPAEYQNIVNTYFNMYKDFCVSFPERETVREENVLLYYQNYEIFKSYLR